MFYFIRREKAFYGLSAGADFNNAYDKHSFRNEEIAKS